MLLIIAFYSTPDIGTTGKMIYIFVTYVLINSVCATFLQSCETVFLGRAVKEDAKRAKILSIGGVIVMLFSAVSSILLPQLMANLARSRGLVEDRTDLWGADAADRNLPFPFCKRDPD